LTRAVLALQAQTLFEISAARRTVRARDPDRAPAPLLYMAGGDEGWIGYVREDVDAARADAIEALIAREPPVTAPDATAMFAENYREILGSEPLTAHNYGPVHRLPRGTHWPGDAQIVRHDSPDGAALVARIRREGVPYGLFNAGFVDLTHFWEPWCVAMVGGEPASIAFCVRDGLLAREVGVYTVGAYRGRGLAAAVTAAWSGLHPHHPMLFYSTHRDNLSSQRVIARLGLPLLGQSLRI
jgi:hypothetical protein